MMLEITKKNAMCNTIFNTVFAIVLNFAVLVVQTTQKNEGFKNSRYKLYNGSSLYVHPFYKDYYLTKLFLILSTMVCANFSLETTVQPAI